MDNLFQSCSPYFVSDPILWWTAIEWLSYTACIGGKLNGVYYLENHEIFTHTENYSLTWFVLIGSIGVSILLFLFRSCMGGEKLPMSLRRGLTPTYPFTITLQLTVDSMRESYLILVCKHQSHVS